MNSPTKTTKNASSSAGEGATDSRLKEFFIDELKDIYYAEKLLVKALPKMKNAATSSELQDAFAEHLEVTKTHVTRLEDVFESLDKKAQSKKCDSMEGITKECERIIGDTEDGTSTRDVGLILGGQKVEHYEIATYGGLHQLAVTLGLVEIADTLAQTLEEEKETNEKLTKIAENSVNYEAAEETV
ncbi:MAG TPA: ferritin-like domain-containing protein [Hanamia sp.]|nr:ferritin-like domain-containing protein [Hanamia sp.]